MGVTVEISGNMAIPRLIAALGPEGRRSLHAVAAEDLANWIQAHIRAYATGRHGTARAFGARPTGHYEKGAAAISTSATAEGGTVTIPIPGINRAWGNITITPKRSRSLTIPLKSGGPEIYGRTVGELRALGWAFFARRGVLFGTRGEGDRRETRAMFVLKTIVVQKQDPSLLPSQDEIARRAATAMVKYVIDVVERARKEKAS